MTSPMTTTSFMLPPEITENEMNVTKRNGQLEIVSFDKILQRIKRIGKELDIKLNFTTLAMKVIDQLYDGISTTKIDELTAEQCASMASIHYDYNALAGRIIISSHQKNTSESFSEVMDQLYHCKDKNGKSSPLVSDELMDVVRQHGKYIDTLCDYSRDFLIDYFGFKTLDRAYLMRVDGKTIERPQHMWMRVAIGIHGADLDAVTQTYDMMSQKYFTHATPTLFNAGTPRPQLSSCYLLSMESDSIDGIYNTLKDCALISKMAGGIGLHIHNVRATGSRIRGTNGTSNGIVPMLRVFNNTAKYVDQGGGKRNGSFAIYIEPWHADIEMFLQMRKNHGDEELKARDLFYALWIPDLFMERVKTNGKWTLMCPDECPGLSDVYGDEFKKLYESYESDGRGRMTVNARDLWFKMLDAQMETGTPYILYKDAVNKKSNQKNIGTIKSSNLCVAPETLILTNQGHIPIGTLKDQTVQVWNGKEFSEVTVHQTGENQEILDVYTDDGLRLSCTPYHKFYIQSSYSLCSIKKVDANNLQPGDKIIKCQYPIIDGSDNMLYAYTHGFFCGDGTYRNVSNVGESPCKFQALENHHFCKRHLFNETDNYVEITDEDITQYTGNCKAMSYSKLPIIYLYDNKRELVSHIECRLDPIHEEQNKRIVVTLPGDIAEKYEVPPATCSLKTKLEWFAGYCDADGSISINGTNEQLQVASINHEFLINVKLMLQTCGINPKIKLLKPDGSSYLPDGKGGHKWYVTKAVYRLLITSCDLYQLVSLGFKPHRLVVSGTEPQRNANQFVKILKVVNENRISDTYCFTEPKRNMGIFNGIITGQCTEITEYSDDTETAVCNLASIGLPMFIRPDGTFDYEFLHSVTKVITLNLNKIIDINYYPTEKTKKSNFRHRPIGIGVQGLADVFILMGFPFSSEEAKTTNRHIFETIYHAALESSMELAKLDGSYETFVGSPAHQGILQFDMWDVKPGNQRYDWDELKEQITLHGLRNSLLLAPMPTASTSQILGFNECIEPITSNIYSRRTLAGEFIQANKYLMSDLISINMWNEKIKNNIIANHGSIQQIDGIPDTIKEKYKTVWEIPMRNLIDMAVDRGAFICQSQSLNLWLEDPNYNTLTSMHFYSWSKGLKTGIYYLRRRGKHQAQQFTIEPEKAKINEEHEDDYICEMCSS
jgi:ribonucleoside-diphosphate reductase alpha chain